jgi:hypothetical protein
MPPDPRDWLLEGHLAWFMLETVRQLDLAPFYASYRQDGRGRAAFEPQMMLALLLYGYAQGERSSRRVERRCVEDVAYRVIAASQAPDHATIARFRVRHEEALASRGIQAPQTGKPMLMLRFALPAPAALDSSDDHLRIKLELHAR